MSLTHDTGEMEAERPPFPKSREPGVWMNLSDEEYHADPAFSASGARSILVSPLTYWVNSRLNPDYEDKDTDAKRFGKAADKLIVEGRAAFDATYAVDPDPADYPGILRTADDLRDVLRARGGKTGGNKADLIARLQERSDCPRIWDVIVAEHEAANAGREKIPADWWRKIRQRAKIIDAHTDAGRAFTGGMPQVSIFWRDEFTGAPMKCRDDYLKTRAIVDLKTFANINDAPPDVAFMRNVTQHRYDVQAAVYLDGLAQAKRFPASAIHGLKDMAWWQEVCRTEAHTFFFVAVQSGDVPNIVVREFAPVVNRERQEFFTGAWGSYRQAVDMYCLCLSTFGPDRPWVTTERSRPFTDQDFPLYHMERLAS